MTASVEPGPAPGQAIIRVPGAAGTAPGFRIGREDYEDGVLGPEGWQSSDAVLQPGRAEDLGGALVLHVGWSVCRYLEAGVYTFALAAGGRAPDAVFWPDIAPLHAGAVDVLAPPAVLASAPVPERPAPKPPAPPVPAASPLPAAAPAAPVVLPDVPRRTGSAPLFGLLALLVLAAAGGGAWWWTHRTPPVAEAQATPPATPPTTPPAPEPPATPPPGTAATPPTPSTTPTPPAPVQLGGLSVPDVLAQAPNPAAVTAEGERRLRGDRRDDGLLLLEASADRGDGGAAAELGRLYDPVGFQQGGPIPRPDPRQAARYYRDAARANVDVTAARDALKRQLDTRAAAGDLAATLVLKDFWP